MIDDVPGRLTGRVADIPLLSGATAPVTVTRVAYQTWKGLGPKNTWRKPVVGPPSAPFAELALAAHLRERGWASGWVYRPGRFLASWEPRSNAVFPADGVALFQRISRAAGQSGAWDVFAWRNGTPLFLEVKWPRDRIRPSQSRWLSEALDLGVSSDAFILVECEQLPNNAADEARLG